MAQYDILGDRRQQELAAMLQAKGQFSPTSLARPNALQGEDPALAALQGIKKLPSTIPKINAETRAIYDKYNKFLNFAGAATNDYSGAKSFQSGLSSALDMDMIQDLLEEQRATSMATQFHAVRPYVKSRPQMSQLAGQMGTTLDEHRDMVNAFESGRPDVKYAKDVQELRKITRELGADEGINWFFQRAEELQKEEGRRWSNIETAQTALQWLGGEEGIDQDAFMDTLNKRLNLQGGLTRSGSIITFRHEHQNTKDIRDALQRAGITRYMEGENAKGDSVIRINPRTTFDVNMNDQDTRIALEDLRRLGVDWAPLPTDRGQRMRLTLGDQPVEGGYFYSNNQHAVDQANAWVAQDPQNRGTVIDQSQSEWEKGRYAVPPAERALYQRQMIGAERVASTAERGLTAIEAGAGGGAGRFMFSVEHLRQMAQDWGLVAQAAGAGPMDDKTFAEALIDESQENLNALRGANMEDLGDADRRQVERTLQKWQDKLGILRRQANNMEPTKQYEAQILLGFLEAGLRAQVARMYISKDRMLASFYNEMKKNINLTGWLQTRAGAATTLRSIRDEARRRIQDLDPYVTEAPKPGVNIDPRSGTISQPEAGINVNELSREQLEALFQQTYGGG